MFRALALSFALIVGSVSTIAAGSRPAASFDGYRGDYARGGFASPGYRNAYHVGPDRYLRDGRRSSFVSYGGPFGRGSGSSYYRGTGIYANAVGAGVYAQEPQFEAVERGPKIIDVASSRLDRQPMPRIGISVEYVGVAKIIRIAPDYDAAERRNGRGHAAEASDEPAERVAAAPTRPLPKPYRPPVAVTPAEPEAADVDPVAPTPAEAANAVAVLEPWTDEWLRDCVARHPSFDASLGTYADEGGRRRFCTGDQG